MQRTPADVILAAVLATCASLAVGWQRGELVGMRELLAAYHPDVLRVALQRGCELGMIGIHNTDWRDPECAGNVGTLVVWPGCDGECRSVIGVALRCT